MRACGTLFHSHVEPNHLFQSCTEAENWLGVLNISPHKSTIHRKNDYWNHILIFLFILSGLQFIRKIRIVEISVLKRVDNPKGAI